MARDYLVQPSLKRRRRWLVIEHDTTSGSMRVAATRPSERTAHTVARRLAYQSQRGPWHS